MKNEQDNDMVWRMRGDERQDTANQTPKLQTKGERRRKGGGGEEKRRREREKSGGGVVLR